MCNRLNKTQQRPPVLNSDNIINRNRTIINKTSTIANNKGSITSGRDSLTETRGGLAQFDFYQIVTSNPEYVSKFCITIGDDLLGQTVKFPDIV